MAFQLRGTGSPRGRRGYALVRHIDSHGNMEPGILPDHRGPCLRAAETFLFRGGRPFSQCLVTAQDRGFRRGDDNRVDSVVFRGLFNQLRFRQLAPVSRSYSRRLGKARTGDWLSLSAVRGMTHRHRQAHSLSEVDEVERNHQAKALLTSRWLR